MFQCILSAVDFSESSLQALREAGRLRDWAGGHLYAIHVIDEEWLYQLADEHQLPREEVVAKAEGRLWTLLAEQGIAHETASAMLLIGHPVREILSCGGNVGADLLVFGAQGSREKETSPSLGAVAGRLVRHCPVDVLIVKRAQDHPFRKIVVGVDFSAATTAVLDRALAIAEEDDAAVTVVHVLPPVGSAVRLGGPLTALGYQDVEIQQESHPAMQVALGEMAHLLDTFRERVDRLQVSTRLLEHARPVEAILEMVQEESIELLVVGKQGRSALKDFLLGSTAEKLANQANCSVLAVGVSS